MMNERRRIITIISRRGDFRAFIITAGAGAMAVELKAQASGRGVAEIDTPR